MSAIVVTWPKTRPLRSYLRELARAADGDQVINFRVPGHPPVKPGERCYMVHDGFVRGYNTVLRVEHRAAGEVTDPVTRRPWPAGWYVVRDPVWHALEKPVRMDGFRSWRYATWADA